MASQRALQLGTRASALARWQAEWVAAGLQARGHAVELVPITTQGDVVSGSLGSAGGVGLFTKELQHALLDGRIDLAVHSLKDLPTEHVPGLMLAGVPKRESVCDALLSRDKLALADLPNGAVLGTGSLRRRAQLLHRRPDLRFVDIRGNVDTRIRKLHAGEYDAIVLAEAGLNRLQLTAHITQVISPLEMLPAVGQGALGIETRTDDSRTRAAVSTLDDPATHAAVLAERSLLLTLLGGCLAPVGAWARTTETGQLALDAVVHSSDGLRRLAAQGQTAEFAQAVDLGRQVANDLLGQGAAALIEQSRRV